MAHVEHLTAEPLQGRKAGSAGERLAAAYIAEQLVAAGVPPPPGAKREQPFPILTYRDADTRQSANVLGFTQGQAEGALRDEVIVVGAHYDHLGVRDGRVHPGAEDNASGVAVVLEIAKQLASDGSALGRSVLWVFFGSEENGMVGSRALVKTPPVPRARLVVMVNVDMIGCPLANQTGLGIAKMALGINSMRSVGIVGTKGRPGLRQIVDEACRAHDLRVVAPEDLPHPLSGLIESYTQGRGDNWPFERAGIPALFFSSGESDEYHSPADVPAILRPEVMQRRARAIQRTVELLSRADRRALSSAASATAAPTAGATAAPTAGATAAPTASASP